MSTNYAKCPIGMRDGYPQFAKRRRQLESQLLEFFAAHQFDLVSTAGYEYVETLLRARPTDEADSWVQLFGGVGKPLALRPEVTPCIARMAAPLLAESDQSLRWCYAERVYRRTHAPASLLWASGRAAESTHVGVESIGVAGTSVDADVLALCVATILGLSVCDIQIVVSHAGVARAILVLVGIPEIEVANLLKQLTKGDYVGFRRALHLAGIQTDVLGILQSLDPLVPSTMDAAIEEIFAERVRAQSDRPEDVHRGVSGVREEDAIQTMRQAWHELVELAGELSRRGLIQYITFDLTLQRDISYYTGIVFEAFAPGVGAPVALGGRYDELLAQFGAAAPAVGFVFELERLLTVVAESDQFDPVAVGGDLLC